MDPVLQRLYETTDATVWADEFCKVARDLGHEIDYQWMVGWFANTIENAKDHEARRTIAVLPDGSAFFVGTTP